MALNINISITVADDQPYTAREAAVLAAMQAHPSNGAAVLAAAAAPAAAPAAAEKSAEGRAADARIAETRAKEAADFKAKVAADAKAKVAADAKAKAAKAAAAAAEPAAAEGVDFAALEAEMEADQAGTAPTLEDAVTKATQMVSDKKTPEVKAALLLAGAKRVSELKGPAIAVFLNALEG